MTNLCGKGKLLMDEYNVKGSEGSLHNYLKRLEVLIDETYQFITEVLR
jgi:hypothetical protein